MWLSPFLYLQFAKKIKKSFKILQLQAWYWWPSMSSSHQTLQYPCTTWHAYSIGMEAVPSSRGVLVGLTPQTKLQVPHWNTEQYKSVVFGQIWECQAPLHKCKVPLLDFLATVLDERAMFRMFNVSQSIRFDTSGLVIARCLAYEAYFSLSLHFRYCITKEVSAILYIRFWRVSYFQA